MRYYLIADDGQKYGPADLATLNQWIAESRLRPDHMLEVETTAQRVQASSVPGLAFGAPQAAQGYYQRPDAYAFDNGAAELKNAWIFSILSIIQCCPLVFGILGIVYSNRAKDKGNPNTTGPLVLSILGLVINAILIVVRVGMTTRYR